MGSKRLLKYRSEITARYREKCELKGKCIICGKKLEENDWRRECKSCRRWHNIRMIADRAFRKDFT